ncbi:branched-chain amino acid transport system permease protein [Variovorax paradoxus]|uniref:branched-chain amino acid ABC transporter permease n=1 Tax=Variovorax atrisoli TaxID=3394203 RepID=UPI00119C603C|nr:branched-chain amino acid ABC transporter permease [Variovorax paradoxus]MDR6520194.1 branched-chain amino acid transport system permease protein [Variovorax paradoxus]
MDLALSDFLNLALNGLAEGLLVALPALAVTLVFGVARFPNAAVGDFVSLGSFGALTAHRLSGGSMLAAGIGAAAAGAAGTWLGWRLAFAPLLRRKGLALLLTSIGVGFVLRAAMGLGFGHEIKLFDLPPMRAWRWGDLVINPLDVFVGGMSLACVVLVFALLRFTSMGRTMRAIADDMDLARVVGIDSRAAMTRMWLLSGIVCGVAGLAYGLKTQVSPESGADMLLPAFAAAVVGGLGNPLGAVLGAIGLGVLQELSTPFVGFTYKIALSYVAMLLVLLWRPQGLFGRVQGVR